MKVLTYRKVLKSTLLLMAIGCLEGAQSAGVSANGTSTTSGGIVHACVGSTVTLGVTGMTTTLAGCCKSGDTSSSWTYDRTDYSWSGDASGSSPSPNLNVSSEGNKTATCSLTHHFKCSSGSATKTTTESASMSTPVKIVANSTQPCVPPTLTGNTVGIPGSLQVTNQLTDVAITGGIRTQTYFNGTWSNRHGTESFTPNGTALQKGCGLDLNETKNFPGGTVSFKYKLFGFTYNFAGGSANATKAAEPFKKIYYQWYDYNIAAADGSFSGTRDIINTQNGIAVSSMSGLQASGVYAMSGPAQAANFSFSTCTVTCCVSN